MTPKSTTSKSGYLRPSTLSGVKIPDHDGLPVTDSAGTITGLQGGFSESARMEAIHVPVGSRVVGLWWGESVSHEYDRVVLNKEPQDEFKETTVYKADAALLIDPDDLEDLIAKHQARVDQARRDAERAAAEARGMHSLPGVHEAADAAAEGKEPEGDEDDNE